MSAPITLIVADGFARIQLNRPDVGNAINLAMAKALLAAAIRCDTEAAIRCVTLTGSGRLFCVGGDIGMMAGAGESLPALMTELMTALHGAVTRLAHMQKPLVTLVNGPAAGAGMSLALVGDIVLCSRSAHFTAAYSGIGFSADGGLSWLLPRLIGLRRSQDLMLTNRRVASDEAETMGLVTRTFAEEDLDVEGQTMAQRLADGPVAAFGAIRALLATTLSNSFETQLDCELRSMIACAGAEGLEGLDAFVAKRRPVFRTA
jgi:2-(1,2-epoxy-1,2-dihydrophenyl)acetyl-CoA isomerase